MCVRKSGLSALTFLLGLSILLLPAASFGQVTTTNMSGAVTDSSGAAVPSAQVTVTNTGTGFTRTAQSGAQGEYHLEFLPIGNYNVEVSANGFKKVVRTGIVLQADQPARVDAQLQLGQVTETIEVTSEIPLVNTSNPEIGRTIETQEMIDLPIVNRNPYTLLDLVPGVQRNDNSIVLGYPEQRTLINGGIDAGAGSVNYYLDGGINMTGLRNTGNILPNPDAIQEFRVQTNNYAADYGRFQNGIVNTITKSGTNNFHGSLFEFVRNTIFNANNWGNTGATPPLHRNQFGGTFGGPIIKNRTFFFGSYAGLRQITSTFLNGAILPSAAELKGDVSQDTVKPVMPGSVTSTNKAGTPFPNNQVPIDPVALKILAMLPTANLPNNKWQGVIPNPYNTDEFLAKVDHNLSDTQRLTFSYFETSGENKVRAGSANLPWSVQQFSWRQHNANASDTWSLNPNMVNQVWLGYTRNFGGRLNLPQTSLTDLGSAAFIQGTPSLPQISVTGFFSLTQAIAGPVAGTNYYSLRDVFSLTHGRHAFRFGGEISLDKDIQATLLNNYGVFGFNGTATTPGNLSKGAACTACALADFELGIPNSATQDAPVNGYTNSWNSALFVQDDFRVTPRLTLNLGVRWDVQTPPSDPENKESTFVPGVQSTVRPNAPVGILFPGDAGITRGIVPIRWNHLSPRLGFALDPFGTGKTSIRGGAGVFYGSVSGNEWNTTSNFEPFAVRLTLNPNVAGTGTLLSNPYRGMNPVPFPFTGGFIPQGNIFGPATNFSWPYTYQFNFSAQQQVTQKLSFQLAYVGSLSHDLPFATDLNYPIQNSTSSTSAANVQSRRPDKDFGPILALRSNQTASYNGLQISAQHRMSHHLTFNGWYAWSKSFDSVQIDNNTAQGGVQNFNNMAGDRGRADIDMRHQAVLSLTFQPDYYTGANGFMRNVVDGWSISPIVRLQSGAPFTISNGADANLDGTNNDRAQLIGDPGISNPSAAEWFNTAAFAKNNPVTGQPVDGNSPRNFLSGPGYKNVDLAIFRRFAIRERMKLEFRAEASNAFNIVNLNNPNATVGTTNFGTITGANSMRQLQLGLRLTY